MRAQVSRIGSIRHLALMGSTVLGLWLAPAAQAQQPVPASPAADAGTDPDIRLPDPPVASVVLSVERDQTGSIGVEAPDGHDAGAALPPALPFDDQAVPLPKPQRVGPGPASMVQPDQATLARPAAADAAPATEPAPATVSAPAALPLDAKPAEPPARSTGTQGLQGLAAADLATSLAVFVAEPPPPSDTPAQAAERRTSREGIAAFYAAHGNQPLWVADGRLTTKARTLLGRLDHAAEDGLDLRGFAVVLPHDDDTAGLAQAELALSDAVVAYGRQASGARVDVAKIGALIDLRPAVADAASILGTVSGATDAGAALQAFNPPQPGYAALRDKLAELRQRPVPEARNRIPSGPVLKRGMRDARVALVRARFGLDVAPSDAGPTLVYDTKVAAAVAGFQRANGLPASGMLTPLTVTALSGGDPTQLENAILANMEEWRWMPRDLGPDRVEVNIPDYSVRVVRDDVVMHEARAIVGKPDKPTPVFAQQMRFMIVNPYWNVPMSIIKTEMMPKLAADPTYFQDHGYEVVERNGQTFVRQPPGDDNALGHIKFMFPNQHSVYLHDTNARSFFGRDMRALSHGCVRVDQPFAFAEAVMGPGSGWTEARVEGLVGGKERTITLPKPLPIYIEYFTAFVDPQSGFRLRDDVYGYEARIKQALGLQG